MKTREDSPHCKPQNSVKPSKLFSEWKKTIKPDLSFKSLIENWLNMNENPVNAMNEPTYWKIFPKLTK